MTTAVGRPAFLFAGFPLRAWAFAIRIWLALVMALYVAFWLELDAPASAAITVAILAVPTRGQGLEKAGFRILATVIGVVASIALIAAFDQSVLALGAIAIWVGLCVLVAGLLDGNRAYAAALGAITVAFIAVEQLDTPADVFLAGLSRGAAVVVGILSVAVVNDLFGAPDYHPAIAGRLEGLHARVADYVRRTVRAGPLPAEEAATLLRDISALRPEIGSLSTESSSGRARSAAARSAMVSLVFTLAAARALGALAAALPPALRERAVEGGPVPEGGTVAAAAAAVSADLVRRAGEVRADVAALRDGRDPPRAWRAPLYRSRRIAAINGTRAALIFAAGAAILYFAGWPASANALALIAILIGLGSTMPEPQQFTTLALLSAPVSSALAGFVEFILLDGVVEFPLLALALAPLVIGASLVVTLPNPRLAAFGRINLIFAVAILMPSNPQSYDPEAFLFAALFSSTAATLLFVLQRIAPPLSRERRARILLAEARRDLAGLPGRRERGSREELAFREASRIGEIVAAVPSGPEGRPLLASAMACFDCAAAIRHAEAALACLPSAPAAAAREALRRRDGPRLLRTATALGREGPEGAAAAAALVVAAAAFAPLPRPPAPAEDPPDGPNVR